MKGLLGLEEGLDETTPHQEHVGLRELIHREPDRGIVARLNIVRETIFTILIRLEDDVRRIDHANVVNLGLTLILHD